MYPFYILELDHDTTDEEVATQYRKLLLHFPPETAPDEFTRIRDAYESVRDTRTRVRTRLFHYHGTAHDLMEPYLSWIQKRPRKRFRLADLRHMLRQ